MSEALRTAVLAARAKFQIYADQHRAKGNPDADAKALVNENMVSQMDAALEAAPFYDLAMRTAAPPESFFPPEHSFQAHLFAQDLRDYIDAARKLDRWKSSLIYGKDKDASAFPDLPDDDALDAAVFDNLTGAPEFVHAVLGITSEGGELAEHLLSAMMGVPIDVNAVSEETGDVDWFQELLAKWLGIPVEQSRADVITKLRLRYPDKFTAEMAVARLDKQD